MAHQLISSLFLFDFYNGRGEKNKVPLPCRTVEHFRIQYNHSYHTNRDEKPVTKEKWS